MPRTLLLRLGLHEGPKLLLRLSLQELKLYPASRPRRNHACRGRQGARQPYEGLSYDLPDDVDPLILPWQRKRQLKLRPDLERLVGLEQHALVADIHGKALQQRLRHRDSRPDVKSHR